MGNLLASTLKGVPGCTSTTHTKLTGEELLLAETEVLEMQHLLHQHPLKLVCMGEEEEDDDDDKDRICAAGCDDALSGHRVYACDPCRFYLHQSCSDLPQRIEHSFHPSCPLFLGLVPRSSDQGGGGDPDQNMMMLSYRCEACEFEMDAACGKKLLLPPCSSEEEGQLMHFSHDHPLELCYVEEEAEIRCNGCGERIKGRSYACNSCGYHLHESCADLPRKIRVFYHSCALVLKIREDSVRCATCGKRFTNTLGYSCRRCNLDMHPECSKAKPVRPGNEGWRWSHEHPLRLFGAETEAIGNCQLCRRKISGQNYAACELCPCIVHESCMEMPLVIRHPCHSCPLVLRSCTWWQYCHTCLDSSTGWHYQCLKCRFSMDAECAGLLSKEIAQVEDDHLLHFCHHHPLRLFNDPKKDRADQAAFRKLECLVCRTPASGLTYGCKQCDVYLHKPCLDVLPQTMSIRDVSFFLSRKGRKQSCQGCRMQTSRWAFLSSPCNAYSWCVPCALRSFLSFTEMVSPSSVSTRLHFHPCTLTLKIFQSFTCNACFTHCHSHAYYCDQCDFYVGIGCAQISMKSSDGGEERRRPHFCHWHPLQLSQDSEVSTASCRICGSPCSQQPFHFCSDCDFRIHESCLDILPQKIDHHYFSCTLVLLTTSSYRCESCQEENNSGLTFRSFERGGFKLCMECVLWPKNKPNDDGTFTSIHHWHQLELVVDIPEKDAICILCRRYISALAYYCRQCKDYFHKTCAELPLEMHHQLHISHHLTLISSHLLPESRRACSLCQGDLLSNDPHSHHCGVYHCKECSFQIDKTCVFGLPSIIYQGHSHPLTIVESMKGEEKCRVCSASCKKHTVFRCAEVECKFVIHLYCGPLPSKIKHPCHVHPLVLEDFYVEDNYTDLFPCHVCEERRDPRLPVYRCVEDCPMICEIECLNSEVMPKLLGAHGEVELRTTFPNVASTVIIKDEGVDGFSPLTLSTFDLYTRALRGFHPVNFSFSFSTSRQGPHHLLTANKHISDAVNRWEDQMIDSAEFEGEDEDERLFTFSEEAFDNFLGKYRLTYLTMLHYQGSPEFLSQHYGSVVDEGGIGLPPSLIPIYHEFFGKSSTIATTYSRPCQDDDDDDEYKSFFVFVLCVVLHNMRMTKLVNVTSTRVLEWLSLLRLLQIAGFDNSRIIRTIKYVWEAHFVIKAKAIVDNTSGQLRCEVERLTRLEEKLLRELEETREKKRGVMEQQDCHHEYERAGMKSLGKKCKRALLFKWKPVGSIVMEDLLEAEAQTPGQSEEDSEEFKP